MCLCNLPTKSACRTITVSVEQFSWRDCRRALWDGESGVGSRPGNSSKQVGPLIGLRKRLIRSATSQRRVLKVSEGQLVRRESGLKLRGVLAHLRCNSCARCWRFLRTCILLGVTSVWLACIYYHPSLFGFEVPSVNRAGRLFGQTT